MDRFDQKYVLFNGPLNWVMSIHHFDFDDSAQMNKTWIYQNAKVSDFPLIKHSFVELVKLANWTKPVNVW